MIATIVLVIGVLRSLRSLAAVNAIVHVIVHAIGRCIRIFDGVNDGV